jgi:glycerate-2-kinase
VVLAAGRPQQDGGSAELAADASTGLAVTRTASARLRSWRSACRPPAPDERSERAAREGDRLPRGRRASFWWLLSGGASALLSRPLPGLLREDLLATTELLLASGVAIAEVNTVRKHLTEISGGRLARRAASRRIEVLAISDVPGDAIETIASGPCAGDPSSHADALGILERHGPGRTPPASSLTWSRAARSRSNLGIRAWRGSRARSSPAIATHWPGLGRRAWSAVCAWSR